MVLFRAAAALSLASLVIAGPLSSIAQGGETWYGNDFLMWQQLGSIPAINCHPSGMYTAPSWSNDGDSK